MPLLILLIALFGLLGFAFAPDAAVASAWGDIMLFVVIGIAILVILGMILNEID